MVEPSHILQTLTDREQEILALMAEGLSNKEIAQQLTLSAGTVTWYTKQIYSKLGVKGRTQASLLAREQGLLNAENAVTDAKPSGPSPAALPEYDSLFVGRDAELAYLEKLVLEQGTRLITVVGPGGTGKTRFAVEFARRVVGHFPDGLFFVSLEGARSVYETPLEALRRQWMPNIPDPETVLNALQGRRMLLIFDSFEPFHDQRAQVKQLLNAVPELVVLVTSQMSLGLQKEWLVRLEGLSAADTESEAVQLFAARVQRMVPAFSLEANRDCVVAICRLLGGMPLALELTATWLKTLSCADTLNELRRNLDMLATNAPDVDDRHRSLRAVFEYAWDLLSPVERQVLRRLSVFRGEFGLSAARQVAGTSLETLAALVDRSLIQRTENGLYRFHEPLRQYAEAKLHSGQEHGKQSKVALAMLSLVQGKVDQVERLADELMSGSSDEFNLDKGFGMALLGVMSSANGDYDDALQLCESSLTVTHDTPIAALFSYLGLAMALCGRGDYANARSMLAHAAQNAQTLGTLSLMRLLLPLVALLQAQGDDPVAAIDSVQLITDSVVEFPNWLLQWPPYAQLRDDLRESFGPDLFNLSGQGAVPLDPRQVVMAYLQP